MSWIQLPPPFACFSFGRITITNNDSPMLIEMDYLKTRMWAPYDQKLTLLIVKPKLSFSVKFRGKSGRREKEEDKASRE